MFRIPDYIARNGLDTTAQPAVSPDDTIATNAMRPGGVLDAAGEALRKPTELRNRPSPTRTQARARTEAAERPPSADNDLLQAHVEKRALESRAFDFELGLHQARLAADQMAEAARATPGEAGNGLTGRLATSLEALRQQTLAGLPADDRPAAAGRLQAEHERRLAKAAAEEVQAKRGFARSSLDAMEQRLLADIAGAPERYAEIVNEGERILAANVLPKAEKAERLAAWRQAAARRLAESLAAREEPGILRRLFGLVGRRPAPGDPSGSADEARTGTETVDLDEMVLHPAFAAGDQALLAKAFGLGDPDQRIAALPLNERVHIARAADERRALDEERAAIEMAVLLRKDAEKIAETGLGLPGVRFADVEAALGRTRAISWRRDRIIGTRLHYALSGLDGLPTPVIESRIAALKPRPGEADFELNQEVFNRARQVADATLRLRESDPAAAVAGLAGVRDAREAWRREPTVENRERLSAAILTAQAHIGIPSHRQTPLSVEESRALAENVLKEEPSRRPGALDALAARLEASHGAYADEALIALMPHLGGDPDLAAHAARVAIALESKLSPGSRRARGRINRRMADLGTEIELPAELVRPVLGELGRLSEDEARAEVTANEAAAVETTRKAQERAARLAKLRDVDLGINPAIESVAERQRVEQAFAPAGLSLDPAAAVTRAARKGLHARDQLAGKAPLPQFSKLRNAVDRAVSSFLSLGPDVAKGAGIVGSLLPGIGDDNALMRAAGDLERNIRQAFPGDQARAGELLSGLAEGGGSMAGYLIGNIVIRESAKLLGASARGVTTAGRAGTAGLSGTVAGVAGFEDAERLGADDIARYAAFFLNAGFGTTDAIPIDHFFGRLNLLTDNKVVNILRTTRAQSLEEFAQEAVASLGHDVIARALYDPERDIDLRAVLKDGTVGAIIGAAMGAGAGASARVPTRSPDRSKYGIITRLSAQRELAKFKKNADKLFASATAEEYFSTVWERLPPHMQDFLEKRYANFVGSAGEDISHDILDRANFEIGQQTRFELPPGIGRSSRNYDAATSEDLKLVLFDLLAIPGKSNDKATGFEVKVASSPDNRDQQAADRYLTGREVATVETLRLPADRITPRDFADVIDRWLDLRDGQNRPGGVPRRDVEELIRGLREKTGPDGKPLTVGQVTLVVLGAALPLLYPDEAGGEETP